MTAIRYSPPVDKSADYRRLITQLPRCAAIVSIPHMVATRRNVAFDAWSPPKLVNVLTYRMVAVDPRAFDGLPTRRNEQVSRRKRGTKFLKMQQSRNVIRAMDKVRGAGRPLVLDAFGGYNRPDYDPTRVFLQSMLYNDSTAQWRPTVHKGRNAWIRERRNPMAIVTLPALSAIARGKVGDIVFMRRAGANIARLRVVPANPRTTDQLAVRQNLSGLSTAWRLAGTTGDVTLLQRTAPGVWTPVTFAYLTMAERNAWPNFQSFIGANARRLSDGLAPIRTPS